MHLRLQWNDDDMAVITFKIIGPAGLLVSSSAIAKRSVVE